MKEFRLADGRTLTYREAGSGPPLVLIHGWSMSSAVFGEALEAFSGSHRVLAVDLKGHGGSSEGEDYALADLSSDLREWIEGLDLRSTSLLGWSFGGEVLLSLYPEVRSRVDRIILVSTTPRFVRCDGWEGGLPEIQVRAMARDLRRDYLKTMGSFFDLQFAGEDLCRQRYRQILEFAVRTSRLPGASAAGKSLETLRTSDLRESLPEIDCPALVMHGGLDRICLPEAGSYLAGKLPRAELAILPEAGHAPFLSRPEETFGIWRKFLL